MNTTTTTSRIVVAVTTVAVCIGGAAFSPPAQAQRVDPAAVGFHQFDDIGYVVAYRKEQMAHDYVANAASLGAHAVHARTRAEIRAAIAEARHADRTTAIVIPVDREQRIGVSESWWDVPIAEVSTIEAVQAARADYVRAKAAERRYL